MQAKSAGHCRKQAYLPALGRLQGCVDPDSDSAPLAFALALALALGLDHVHAVDHRRLLQFWNLVFVPTPTDPNTPDHEFVLLLGWGRVCDLVWAQRFRVQVLSLDEVVGQHTDLTVSDELGHDRVDLLGKNCGVPGMRSCRKVELVGLSVVAVEVLPGSILASDHLFLCCRVLLQGPVLGLTCLLSRLWFQTVPG